MHAPTLTVIALAAVLFAAVSRQAERRHLTAPMVFVAAGVLVGPVGLDIVQLPLRTTLINVLAQATLILTLFVDAARVDVSRLGREHVAPLRMLGLGLPLMMAIGTGCALLLFPGLDWRLALLLGVLLAPTDAALGQAVINDPRLPVRVRQGLNVESGLNDGLTFPALLIVLALIGEEEHTATVGHWIEVVARQLTLGPITGLVIGYSAGRLLEMSYRRQWMDATFARIGLLGVAFLAFGAAEIVGGNGFISAFVAGGVVGTRDRDLLKPLEQFGEAEGQLLSLLVFLMFGAALVPHAGIPTTTIVAYALISLLGVRTAAVGLSLLGARLRYPTIFFFGWFGPRGLASIIYLLLAVEAGAVVVGDTVFATVVLTVSLSILLHGISAQPLSAAYASGRARPDGRAAP